MLNHVIYIIGASLVATILLLPISALDSYYIASFNKFPFLITVPIMVGADIFSAILAYKLSYLLIPLVVRTDKKREKLRGVGEKLQKTGFWGLVIAACTPLPYSLFIYTAGVVGWGSLRQFTVAILIGRTIKYGLITAGIMFGISIF